MKPSRWILLISLFATALPLWAQTDSIDVDTLYQTQELQSVVVSGSTGNRSRYSIMNAEIIGQQQLVRAACCNLGESFTTNPSVDVNYSDAATGARQIRLLGLSGTYVQMMTENVPNFRGASIPYSLGYVPGPWMQSVQVSKGAASVKNGYESLTGQINIEYKKPQATDGIRGNAYFDSKLRQEVNADGSIHISDALSASLLAHVENRQTDHDANGDGFLDMPKLKQYNLMNRWAYVTPGFISQLYVSMLGDERTSGMSSHSHAHDIEYYGVSVETKRYDLQWKNAFILNSDHNTSIALMLHGTLHDSDNMFGHTLYDVNQNTAYAQLMFESDINEMHNIAAGLSLNHDYFKEVIDGTNIAPGIDHNSETTSGAYLQYTFKPNEKVIVMPGVRWDYSDVYHGFFTPRLHIKYSPISELSLRASAGLGYRSPHALAENTPLLATGRTYIIANDLQQEKSFNWGISASLNKYIADKPLELNVEYYYTDFARQMIINYDGAKGDYTLSFENLQGSSYSHTFQIDATYSFFEGFASTAAFRYNDVRTTYDGVLRRKPLTPKYKGLLTLSYKTPTELWQFDVTAQLNGNGELYDHSSYPAYGQLQAQITREFRHFSIYVGGENLTNYRIKNPIIGAANPWASSFDATQVWGPTDGAMAYIGLRITFDKL